MSIKITKTNLIPTRRDKQISSISISGGGGTSVGGSTGGGSSLAGLSWSGDTLVIQGNVYVSGDTRAYGDVMAYSSSEAPINWWDNLPGELNSILGTGLTMADGLLYTTGGGSDASLSTIVSNEIVTRTSVDTSLSSAISSTISTYTSKDNSLSTIISGGISSISAGLSNEIVTRTSVDTSLSSAISSTISTYTSKDNSLSTIISGSISSISAGLSNEIVKTSGISWTNSGITFSGDIYINGNVRALGDVEAFSSEDAPINWWDNLEGEISSMLGTGLTMSDGLLYTTGGGGSDASLSTIVSNEIVTRTSVDTSLSSALSNEIGTRGSADTSLSTRINGKLDYRTFGTAADNNTGDFATAGHNHTGTYAPLANPTFTGTVGGITASMVGLGNVTNESKATMLTNPTFTGIITRGSSGTNGVGDTPSWTEWLTAYENDSTHASKILTGNSGYGDHGTWMKFQINLTNNSSSPFDAIVINHHGQVGIGTATPTRQLTIRKDVANGVGASLYLNNLQYGGNVGAETEILMGHYDDGNPYRYAKIHTVGATADGRVDRLSIGFADYPDAYNDYFTIKNGGKVGIGNTSPDSKLHISGSDEFLFRISRDGTKTWGWGTDAYGMYLHNLTDGVLPIYLKNGGNVGIGTTNPDDVRLAVYDTTAGATGVKRLLDLTNGTDANLNVYISKVGAASKYADISSYSTIPLVLNSQSGGNVGIGTTAPTNKLEVAGNITVFTSATNPASSATLKGLTLGYDNYSENSWIQSARNNSGELRGLQINPLGGNVYMSSNLYVAGEVTAYYSSDERLKKNIKSFKALDTISKLKPVEYNWNDTAVSLNNQKNTDTINYGLIAQDVENVLPELVHKIYDEYKSVDYVQLVPILIQAVKEQQQQIKYLKSDLDYVLKNFHK